MVEVIDLFVRMRPLVLFWVLFCASIVYSSNLSFVGIPALLVKASLEIPRLVWKLGPPVLFWALVFNGRFFLFVSFVFMRASRF